MRDQTDAKIFCIGFNKTGTTTLHRVFRDQLGYRSIHSNKWSDWSVSRNVARLSEYQAFSDGEWASVRNLDELYPNAVFILNTRPLEHWLLSRHKAVERSRAAVRWAFTRFVPMGWVAHLVNRWVLDNSDGAMVRWICVRNSFHAHVLDYFRGREHKLLILNIEDEGAFVQLGRFLGVEHPITPTIENPEGQGSKASSLVGAIGEKVHRTSSEGAVEACIVAHQLDEHRTNVTVFELSSWRISRSGADRVVRLFPFLKPVFRRAYQKLVARRPEVRNALGRWALDCFIRACRSEQDVNYFTTVRRLASASK